MAPAKHFKIWTRTVTAQNTASRYYLPGIYRTEAAALAAIDTRKWFDARAGESRIYNLELTSTF